MNYNPKYKIIKLDAYSIIRDHAVSAISVLRWCNGIGDRNEHQPLLTIFAIMKEMAAMFTPVDQMSPAVKQLITYHYKNSTLPCRIYLMQLNNKRVLVK